MIAGYSGHRVYLDANVFIYALEQFPKYAKLCAEILQAIEDQALFAVTSEITLAEVLVRPLRKQQQAIVNSYERLLQSRHSFEVVSVSRAVLRDSADLRVSLGGRLPDAIHVATALRHKADFFFTADKSLKTPPSIKRITLDDLLQQERG